MSDKTLVQPLFQGPVDVVADVHGEIDALRDLLRHLGYGSDGVHPEGRRLVFLGDLTDRGPDSPAVVRLVSRLLDGGLAQCVLGNHDLNLLLGERKQGNAWFYGDEEKLDSSGRVVPQAPADEETRGLTLDLFGRLPLVLEGEGLRVVHACWHPGMVERVRGEADVVALLRRYQALIEGELDQFARGQDVGRLLRKFAVRPEEAEATFLRRVDGGWLPPGPESEPPPERLRKGVADPTGRKLALQDWNPVKVLTSGLERRAARPFEASGKVRNEERVPWWDPYGDEPWCVFGHYGRTRLAGEPQRDQPRSERDHPFDDSRPYAALGKGGRAVCIDYSAARRWQERPPFGGGPPYRTALAALRWPERWLYFDTGRPVPLASAPPDGRAPGTP
jgi:Calcineurin-like phosphoesterase